MEETTTTAAVAAVTSPAISNPAATDAQPIADSSKIREEGELSASENDDNARSQFPDGTILAAPPLNKGTSVVEKGVSASILNPAVASRTIAYSNKRKGVEKNRVPFVISFSDDDDSGSDSEEYKKETAMESGDMTRGTIDNRKLSTSMVSSRSQMVQQTGKTNTKSPKKLSTSRTFVSSVNRVNGAKFKNGGSTFVGVKTHLKKSTPPSIIKFGQKAPNIHVNSNKLQDLRQLIAIREN
ncbi:uncharacterized protein LOC143591337 [Bidens hawaiensis]|uniref:uncharacterized protein LOC143591337 n=1 Tax=Bidens hawaiensis TaxID=980011 RepID=UPI00404B315A